MLLTVRHFSNNSIFGGSFALSSIFNSVPNTQVCHSSGAVGALDFPLADGTSSAGPTALLLPSPCDFSPPQAAPVDSTPTGITAVATYDKDDVEQKVADATSTAPVEAHVLPDIPSHRFLTPPPLPSSHLSQVAWLQPSHL